MIIKRWLNSGSPLYGIRLSIFLNFIAAAAGIYLGLENHSMTVYSNGFVFLNEFIYSVLFYYAVSQSLRSPEMFFNYGYGKYERLAVIINLTALSVFLLLMLHLYFYAVRQPVVNDSFPALIVYQAVLVLFVFSIYKLELKSAVRYKRKLLFDNAIKWKNGIYIEVLILLLIITQALLYRNNYLSEEWYFDSAASVLVILIAVYRPIRSVKDSLRQVLDRNLPESIQFDILSVLTENLNKICEFKTIHTRKSGKDLFIEIDVILPYDMTLEQSYEVEQILAAGIKEKYPDAHPRLYVLPCNRDCVYYSSGVCPVKAGYESSKEQ